MTDLVKLEYSASEMRDNSCRMTWTLDELRGYDQTIALRGNCGPTALAIALKESVPEVERQLAEVCQKGANWRGSTTANELRAIAHKLELDYVARTYLKRIRFTDWFRGYRRDNRGYMVRVTGHWFFVYNDIVTDQKGPRLFSDMTKGHRKLIKEVWEIRP